VLESPVWRILAGKEIKKIEGKSREERRRVAKYCIKLRKTKDNIYNNSVEFLAEIVTPTPGLSPDYAETSAASEVKLKTHTFET
jgi:hypothetical protein